MTKLPVFATFGNALGFAFGSFFTVFRLTWLPFAMLIAANLAIGIYVQEMILHDTPRIDPFSIASHIDDFIVAQIAVIILQAIAIAAAAVSVHRVILFGDRKPGVYFNFPFGGTEFLYVMMGLVWATIILLIMAIVFAPVIFLISSGDPAAFFAKMQDVFKDWPPKGKPGPEFFRTLGPLMFAYFVGWIIALYVGLRLMVWPPAIVATRRFALGEAWALTRGNVWRFIGLFLLVGFLFYGLILIPAGAAYWYYVNKMKPAQVEETIDATTHDNAVITGQTTHVAPDSNAIEEPEMTDDQREALQEKMRLQMERNMEAFAPFAPLFWLLELLFYVFFTGLGVALLSYSYKALKGYNAREPISEGS